jgi:hypothetical protein
MEPTESTHHIHEPRRTVMTPNPKQRRKRKPSPGPILLGEDLFPKTLDELKELAETNARVIVRPPFSWFDDRFYPVLRPDNVVDYYPSVTTILGVSPKPFYARLRGDLGNEEMDRRIAAGADRGSRIHHACYEYARGGIVLFDQKPWLPRHVWKREEVETLVKELEGDARLIIIRDQNEFWQVEKWAEWLYRTKARVVATEMTVISHQCKYAGTLDYLLDHDGGRYLIAGAKGLELHQGLNVWDIKSGWPSETDVLQIAAYFHALREQRPNLPLAGAGVVYTDADVKNGIEGLMTKYYSARELEGNYFPVFMSHFQVFQYHNQSLKPTVREFEPVLSLSKFKERKESHEKKTPAGKAVRGKRPKGSETR